MVNRGILEMVTNGENRGEREELRGALAVLDREEKIVAAMTKRGDPNEIVQTYFRLLTDAQTGVRRVYHRRNISFDGPLHTKGYDLIAILDLDNPDTERDIQAYNCEVEMTRIYPMDNISYEVLSLEQLTESKEKGLLDAGFELYNNK